GTAQLSNDSTPLAYRVIQPTMVEIGRIPFELNFSALKDLSFPVILGMHWWEQAKCNIDCETHQVNIFSNEKYGNVTLGQTTASSLNVMEILPTLESLLLQYEDVFSGAHFQTLPECRASNL
ncbi:hypothetical protein DSO57_1021344, partial [Entomophthora muscae]